MVSSQLNKDPNELNEKDFAKITELSISNEKLVDIKLLEHFTNLRVLKIDFYLPYGIPEATPIWKRILKKLGIIKIPKQYTPPWVHPQTIITMDITPLKKLRHLQNLSLSGMRITNIKPLALLSNLKELSLVSTGIEDVKPLGKLKNLEKLNLDSNPISDFEPLKKLTNLQWLNIKSSSKKLTREKLVDLVDALPNVKINRL